MKTNPTPRASPFKVLLALSLLALPVAVQAQFTFVTSNSAITITGYTGPGGAVTIPDTINGLPVASIGDFAFRNGSTLSSVTIPDSVTGIGGSAFSFCYGLTNVVIGNRVISIGDAAFSGCASLTSAMIPDGVTTIGEQAFLQCYGLKKISIGNGVTSIGIDAFRDCASLTNVLMGNSVTYIVGGAFSRCTSLPSITIPDSVTHVGDYAFWECGSLTNIVMGTSVTAVQRRAFGNCTSLTGVYFRGNAPSFEPEVFLDAPTTIYYLPGTTGWGTTLGGRPTAPWRLPYPLLLNFGPSLGVQTNGFGFIISWATNRAVVVEACADLAQSVWTPVSTNALVNGSSQFNDPDWTNHLARFYRLRSVP